MKTSSLLCVGMLAIAGLMCNTAHAVFDLMQIEQVIGGVDGDTTKQAIQLRMRSSFQTFVSAARMRVFDAQGLNPVIVIDFASDVAFSACGRRVLITSANFVLDPSITSDFTMTNLIPASYLAAGSLTFEDNLGNFVFWRLSWGGAGYTGPTNGSCVNDDSVCPLPGNFGVWPNAVPSTPQRALQFQPACNALSTTNQNDYAVTVGQSVWTNNANQSGTVPVCPGDTNGDKAVNVLDLVQLLLCFGDPATPPCDTGQDVNQDNAINVLDLVQLLLAFGTACP